MKFTVINADGSTSIQESLPTADGTEQITLDSGQELDLRGRQINDVSVEGGDILLKFGDGTELKVDLPVNAAAQNAGLYLRFGAESLTENSFEDAGDVSPADMQMVLDALAERAFKLTVSLNELGEAFLGIELADAGLKPIDINSSNVIQQLGEQLALVSSFVNPPALTNQLGSVNEGAANGLIVLDLNDRFTGTDADRDGQAMRYAIVAGDAEGVFTINARTGQITVANGDLLDSLVTAQYQLTVRATSGAESATAQVVIDVLAANDNAPEIIAILPGEVGSSSVFVQATDADPDDVLTFSLIGGVDQALLQIDATTGLLSFISSPDFESPADADGDNIYNVVVQVSDGLNTSAREIALRVTDRNDTAPVLPANAAVTIVEETTAVTRIIAIDPDTTGEATTYRISGGDDAALFEIDAQTGVLVFRVAPDFENPADTNNDNVYQVIIEASDGSNAAEQILSVTVLDAAEPDLQFSSQDIATVPEATSAVLNVVASDVNSSSGGAISYAITGGADAALFQINSTTGTLQFVSAPDFESPIDTGADNVYDLTVTASNGNAANDVSQNIAVTVTNVNEAPSIVNVGSPVPGPGSEDIVAVIEADDPDGEVGGAGLTYLVSGGPDGSLFQIDSVSGELSFIAPPDFENPRDSDLDNIYQVEVSVEDAAGLSDSQLVFIAVTNVNEPPEIISNGGAPFADITVLENNFLVTDVESLDDANEEAGGLVYSISGGEDQALFSIDPTSGELNFFSAPDFENPLDSDLDNVYRVEVTVTDAGGLTDVQDLRVTVVDDNELPVIISNGGGETAAITVDETTVNVTDVNTQDEDVEFGGLSYGINGGSDAALFFIDSTTGALRFINAPDFENPLDSDLNNVYNIQVAVTDSGGLVDTQDIAVTVRDKQEAPVITSNGGGDTASFSIQENTLGPNNVDAIDSDGDVEGNGLTYTLTGADSALLTINSNTGVFQFVSPPNFEAPADFDANNVYDFVVTVTDSDGLTDTQQFAITVTNVNDAPRIVSNGGEINAAISIDENAVAVTDVEASDEEDAEGSGLIYSISGGDDSGLFVIDSATGALSFVDPPDFESPLDAGSNNVYDVQVAVTDSGGLSGLQDIAVTVGDVNEAPSISGNSIGIPFTYSIIENTLGPFDVSATDPEGDTEGAGLSYALSGTDSGFLTIDANTGALQFLNPRDFEAPADSNGDNVYEYNIIVTDSGGLTDTQIVEATITDVNETPRITSDGGAANAVINVAENTTLVTDVQSSDEEDEELGGLTYSISGGDDGEIFTIDTATGALSFVNAPDFENPQDIGLNNVYDVQVAVTDSGGLSGFQDIAVTVTDVNEAPVITSNGGGDNATFSIQENTLGPNDVSAIDSDGDVEGRGLSYTLSGTDSALFTIDTATGVFQFLSAPNFEAPADTDGNNVYEFDVTVTDSDGLTDTQSFSLSVTDDNDAPVITSDGGGVVANISADEDQLAVTDVQSSDEDLDTEGNGLTYDLFGGNDVGAFDIDANTGELTFSFAPDFEAQEDANGDNVFEVTVRVTDSGGRVDTQNVFVSLNDVNESPFIISNGGGDNAAFSIFENTLGPNDVDAIDPEGDVEGAGLTYTLAGTDSALFSIDANSGVFQFLTAPDFEAPADANTDNIYEFEVTVSDSASLTDTQSFALTVLDQPANLAPTNTLPLNGAKTPIGSASAITGLSIADPDSGANDLSTSFRVTSGTLTVATNVAGGVPAASIIGNGTDNVILQGSASQINTTLADATGLTYVRVESHGFATSGTDTLIMTTNDLGNSGDGSAQSDVDNIAVRTNFIDLAPNASPLTGLIEGVAAEDLAGFSVSSAGDFNGDGLDDFIIGAPKASPDATRAGAGVAYVVFNPGTLASPIDLTTLDGLNGFAIHAASTGDSLGESVSALGDLNGDGFDDIIIGASGVIYNDGGGAGDFSAGESYVIFGSGSTIPPVLDVNTLDGLNGFRLSPLESDEFSGRSVSSAGDVNGDGLADLIIGAPEANTGEVPGAGRAYVVFGVPGGRSLPPLFDLSSLSGFDGFSITGDPFTASQIGERVSSLGDINGDGFDDIIVAAPLAGPGAEGEAHVIYGSQFFSGNVDVQTLGGTQGFSIKGINAGDEAGRDVGSAGDFNGDGFDDILVGSARNDAGGADAGAGYLIFGGTSIDAGTGSLALSALNGSNGFSFLAGNAGDETGYSLAGIGDINGDGFDDILVGARFGDAGGADSGVSYVVFGSSTSPGAVLSLGGLDGSNGFVLLGADGGDLSGHDVSGAGDVNGDGFDDILVGATGGNASGANTGEAYFIFGGDFGSSVTSFGGANDNVMTGDAFNNTLVGGQGSDTLDGGAGDDILIGGSGNDLVIFDPTDSLRVDGGSGMDTLRFDAPINLDLSQVDNGLYTRFETLDLNAQGADVNLTIGVGDVLDMSDTSDLTILGNATDTVNFFAGSGVTDNDIQGGWSFFSDAGSQNIFAFQGGASGDILAFVTIDDAVVVTGAAAP